MTDNVCNELESKDGIVTALNGPPRHITAVQYLIYYRTEQHSPESIQSLLERVVTDEIPDRLSYAVNSQYLDISEAREVVEQKTIHGDFLASKSSLSCVKAEVSHMTNNSQ